MPACPGPSSSSSSLVAGSTSCLALFHAGVCLKPFLLLLLLLFFSSHAHATEEVSFVLSCRGEHREEYIYTKKNRFGRKGACAKVWQGRQQCGREEVGRKAGKRVGRKRVGDDYAKAGSM